IAPVRSVAAIGGLALVSFVVVVGNALLAETVHATGVLRPRYSGSQDALGLRGTVAPVCGLLAIAIGVGVWFVAWPRQPATGRLHVALVQGNDLDRYLTTAELDARLLPAQHFALADRLHGR